MSTTVDQRVVEMRFDNQQFERNVSTTMSTLDKLKQKLHLDGASKGLDGINKAAKNVNMSGLSSSVETVRNRFSALEVMGVTALANITNSAVNAGKRIVSALTIDPIKTGLSEYETKINAIQVIKANTRGKNTMDEITAALDDLNDYADRTIYNFAQMTSNVGKFVAQGLDVNQAAKAVEGLANLAGASGASAEDMARATYQMSQALGGTIRKIDWNSLRTANMASVELKNTLMDLARVNNIAIDDMIAKHGTFEDTLSEGWLTGDLFTEAMNIYSDVYSEAELKAKGFTDEQIANFKDLAKTAKEATTEVKTFSQLWDVLKESAQSGWTQTWELIIGDFDSAKKSLTELQVYFSGIIDAMSDRRNFILGGALNFSKAWVSITEKFDKSGIGKIKEVADAVGKVTDKLEYYQEVVRKVWRGDYNNVGDEQDRFDLLEKAGYDYRVVQDLVNKGKDYKLTIEDIEASHKKFGLTLDTTTEETKEATKSFESLTDEKLKDAGLTEDEISLYRALEKEANRLGISVDELVEKMSKNDGRTLLIDSLKNVWQGLANIAKVAKEAWVEIFDPPTSGEIIVKLYGMIEALNRFTEKLTLVNKDTGELTETAKKFKRILKGVFAGIDIITTIMGGAFKAVFTVVTEVLKRFGLNLLDVVAAVADAIVKFRDWLFEGSFISKIFNGSITVLASFIKKIAELVKAFSELPAVQNTVEKIKKAFTFENIVNTLKSFGNTVKGWIESFKELPFVQKIVEAFGESFKNVSNFGKSLVDGFIEGLNDGSKTLWDVIVEFAGNILSKIREVLGIHSPSTETKSDGQNLILGFIEGVQSALSGLWTFLKGVGSKIADFLSNISWGKVFAVGMSAGLIFIVNKIINVLGAITSPLKGLSDVLEGAGDVLESVSYTIKKSAKSIKKVLKSFSKVLSAVAFDIKMQGVKTLVTSILMLVGAIIVLTFFDTDKLWDAVGIVAALTGILAGLILAVEGLSALSRKNGANALDFGGLSLALLGISAALLLIGKTVKMIGSLSPDQCEQAFAGFVAIILGLVVVLAAYDRFVSGGKLESIDKIGPMMLRLSASLLILAIVAKILGGMDATKMERAGEGLMTFLVVIGGIILALSYVKDNVDDAAKALVKISGAMLILAIVAKIMGGIDDNAMNQAVKGLIILTAVIFALILIVSIAEGKADNIGNTLLKIAGAIAILGIVAKVLARMSPEEMERGLGGLFAFVGVVFALVLIVSIAEKVANNLGTTLLAISGAMFILALTAKILGGMSVDALVGAGAGLLGLVVVVALLVKITQMAGHDAPKIAATLLALSLAIAILVGVAVILSLVPLDGLAKGVAAVTVLGIVMAGMIKATRGANECKGSLIAMSIAIAVMAAAVAALSFIEFPNLAGATAALAALMYMFGYMAKQVDGVKGSMATLIVMSVVVALLAGVIYVLSTLPVENVIGSAVALSILTYVMAGVMTGLAKANLNIKDALLGILALTLMAVPLIAFVGVLAAMQGVENAITNAIVLSGLATVMTALLIPLSGMGALIAMSGGVILSGILALTLMAVPLIAFVGVLAAMQGIQNAAANTMLLISLATIMTGLLTQLAIIGPFALIGVAALASLSALMIALGALAVGIGALVWNFSTVETFLNTGIPIMIKLAEGLGAMIGGFINGVATAIAAGLPEIGQCLSDFMANAMFFILGAKLVDDKVLAGVGILAASVLALTAVDFIEGISSFLQGGSSFSTLGTELSNFMNNAMPFIVGAMLITPKTLEGVKALAETILILTAADVVNGLTSWFTGGSSLENFGSQLGLLGDGISEFKERIGNFGDEDVTTMNCAAKAIKTLAEASAAIPNTGGLLGAIVGENDLGTFADQFPTLGNGLAKFLANVGTFSDEQVKTVDCAAKAIKTLAEASSQIPNSGGWLGQIVGENDLGTFADQFPNLGLGLAGFLTNVGTFTDEQVKTVDCAAKAIKTLAEASSQIPNSGGWLGEIVGENDLGDFANQFPTFGTGLAGFLTNVGTLGEDQLNVITYAADAIKVLAEASSKIPNSGGWLAEIVGDKSLGNFANEFPVVGKGIKGFADELGEFSEDKLRTVKIGVSAVAAIADLSGTDLSKTNKNISSFGSKLSEFGKKIGEFCKGISEVDNASLNTGITYIEKLAKLIKSHLSGINASDATAFKDALADLSTKAVKKFVDGFTSSDTNADIAEGLHNFITKVTEGIAGKETKLKEAIADLVSSGVSAIKTQNNYDKYKGAGSYLVDGFVEGINANTFKAEAEAAAMATAAKTAAEEALDENSPSKVFYGIGDYAGLGFVNALGDYKDKSYKAGFSMADSARTGLSNAIKKIRDAINSDMDVQPTIRPVLDLSDVQSGAGAINSMLGLTSPVGVMANVGSINSTMNRRIQNGANSDVVSAINGLRKEIGTSRGDSYTINGITYDDGSNIADAVKAIVRAARVERRV